MFTSVLSFLCRVTKSIIYLTIALIVTNLSSHILPIYPASKEHRISSVLYSFVEIRKFRRENIVVADSLVRRELNKSIRALHFGYDRRKVFILTAFFYS